MADYSQPETVEKRVRFFDGQFLVDQDFIDEQKYHLDRERRLSRLLRVTGVAAGLKVSATKANQVKVTKGAAVDSLGRQLALADDRTVDLPAAKFNNQQGVSLYILYQETPVDLATTGSKSERRWLEKPQIVAATAGGESTEPWDSQTIPVLLARLNLDNNGTVTVDGSATQYAGLSLSGNVGIGTTEPGSYKLNVQGGDTHLGGKLQVDGTSTFAGNVGIGTLSPAANLDVAGVVKAASFIGDGAVPKGVIVMWSGAINVIPNGWALCNGQNGTPDLTDRFVVAAGGLYPVNDKRGDSSHMHTVDIGTPPMSSQSGQPVGNGGGGTWVYFTPAHSHTVNIGVKSSNAVSNLPPYFALAYIMKL